MTATTIDKLEIRRLDEKRYAVTLDGLVRYVGTQEECERRAEILSLKAVPPRTKHWRDLCN